MSDPYTHRKTGTVLMIFLTVAVWASGIHAGHAARRESDHPLVKHIILFIGDGMQLAHEIAASRYLFGRDDSLVFHRFPYRGYVATWDVSTYNYWARQRSIPPFKPEHFLPWLGYDISRGGIQPYPLQTTELDAAYLTAAATDSASAATAWATGHKTDTGNIAWRFGDPPNGSLSTIAEILRRERGFAIGVVSTVPFTHATPAAHVSHNVDRKDTIGIAREIIYTIQPDVVIGGGHPQWYGRFTYLSESDYAALKKDGVGGVYDFIERQTGIDGAVALQAAAQDAVINKKKLFGLFGGRDGNLESPQPQDRPQAPSVVRGTIENPLLKDSVSAALTLLSQEPRGFFVLFEQGDIDWANHANDYQRMIGTIWDLDLAVQSAIAFVNQPDDIIDWSNTLLIVTADHGNSHLRFGKRLGRGELPLQISAADAPCEAVYCGKYIYPDNEIRYASSGHTNELVRLYALGSGIHLFEKYEGAWYSGTRIVDNTHIFNVMVEAAGVSQPRLSKSLQRTPSVGDMPDSTD